MPLNSRGQRVRNNTMSKQQDTANALRSTTAQLQSGKPPRGPKTPKTSSKGKKSSTGAAVGGS